MRHVAPSRFVPVQFWTVLLCLGLVFSIYYLWNTEPLFPISVVKVEADYNYAEPSTIEKVISSDFPAGFWTVDLRALRTKLQKMTWVQSVNVEKVWPKTLKIQLQEKRALARWENNGVVSLAGEVFYPEEILPKTKSQLGALPSLSGPEEDAPQVIQMYQAITEKLNPYHLKAQRVHLSVSGAWSIVLSDGNELLLGTEQPLIRLERFLQLQNTMFAHHNAKRVDLRYEHGLAVTWAPDDEGLNEHQSTDNKI